MRMVVLFISLLSSQVIQGQVKNEREIRLKKDDVPQSIIESVADYLKSSKKIRFFHETDNEKKSYEVKLIFDGSKYSIEFDEAGTLEDIEKTIPFEMLPENGIHGIKEYLDSFDKHRIDKVQKQFSSKSGQNKQIIKKALLDQSGDIIQYELEVDVKKQGKWTSYEMLFSNNGDLISKREIIHRSSDFILY